MLRRRPSFTEHRRLGKMLQAIDTATFWKGNLKSEISDFKEARAGKGELKRASGCGVFQERHCVWTAMRNEFRARVLGRYTVYAG